MCNDLVPLLLLVIAPLAYFTARLGLLCSQVLRAVGLFFVLSLAIFKLPLAGLEDPYLDRLKFALALSVAVVLLLRHARLRWWQRDENYRVVLTAITAASVLVYLNFFSFHGRHSFVHYHELAHYYLGSKYFAELGYGNLYLAALRAEAEAYGNRFASRQARDLSTNAVVPVEQLLPRAEAVKTRFSGERWRAFCRDLSFFRDRMGPRYTAFFTDHGFNPTPLWATIGGFIANRVPAGDPRAIVALAALDPLLLLLALGAIGWTFGTEILLLALAYFCLIFGASFGWLGGAYLRQLWFAGVVVGACCLYKGRPATAGSLFALASLLRVFPAFFAAGVLAKIAARVLWERKLSRDHLLFSLSFCGSAAALLLATLVVHGEAGAWNAFLRNLTTHMESLSSNSIGLTNLFAYWTGVDIVGAGPGALFEWRMTLYRFQLALVAPAVLLLVGAAARRLDDLSAASLGILLLLATINLSAYYFTFLLLLLLARRDEPGRVAMLFLIEAASYYLGLFEEHAVMLYLYRGLLVLYVTLALYLDDFRRAFTRQPKVASTEAALDRLRRSELASR